MIVLNQPALDATYSSGSYRSSAKVGFYQTPTMWGNDIYLQWSGTGNWQVQYQQRSRLKYAGVDTESWTAWGAVQKLYTTGNATAAYSDGIREIYATPLSLVASDFTGAYDAQQFRVQVRPLGADDDAWETADLTVYYCPDWTVETAAYDPTEKTVTLTVDTGTVRPPKGFELNYVFVPGMGALKKMGITDYTLIPATGSSNAKVVSVIPAKYASLIPMSGASINAVLTGDVQGVYYTKAFTLSYADPSEYIAEPDNITLEELDTGLKVTVPHHAAGGGKVAYQSVTAVYSWTDARGTYTAGSVELANVDSNWIGEIPAPPYGATVAVDVTANGTKNSLPVYNTATVTHDMASCLRYSLTYGEEFFWLGFNLAFSRQTDVDSDIIALASGRRVARHGRASTTKINLSGVIVDALTATVFGAQSKWLPDVETLHEPHDWILRTPSGERCRVAITSVTRDQGHFHYATATVEMEEVD